ncbi:hypothetical protein HDU93_001496 [Gonapodya sp. JEL0774]|nr:hypothetical protein HDU93_001496 [Gonapodya sp. JEL0774]
MTITGANVAHLHHALSRLAAAQASEKVQNQQYNTLMKAIVEDHPLSESDHMLTKKDNVANKSPVEFARTRRRRAVSEPLRAAKSVPDAVNVDPSSLAAAVWDRFCGSDADLSLVIVPDRIPFERRMRRTHTTEQRSSAILISSSFSGKSSLTPHSDHSVSPPPPSPLSRSRSSPNFPHSPPDPSKLLRLAKLRRHFKPEEPTGVSFRRRIFWRGVKSRSVDCEKMGPAAAGGISGKQRGNNEAVEQKAGGRMRLEGR